MMQFINNLQAMSIDELQAIGKDIMAFFRWSIHDVFPAVCFTVAMLAFLYVGFYCVGWL